MALVQEYLKAMAECDSSHAYAIECDFGLDGYPPELVLVGLTAIDEGKYPFEAISEYTGGAC